MDNDAEGKERLALKQFQRSRYTLRFLVQANHPARIRAAAARLMEVKENVTELMKDKVRTEVRTTR